MLIRFPSRSARVVLPTVYQQPRERILGERAFPSRSARVVLPTWGWDASQWMGDVRQGFHRAQRESSFQHRTNDINEFSYTACFHRAQRESSFQPSARRGLRRPKIPGFHRAQRESSFQRNASLEVHAYRQTDVSIALSASRPSNSSWCPS